jgi:HAD superfamily hydrolase (TIGR01490 family)
MSEFTGLVAPAHSAAFFDLDRTLISGSSAYTVAVTAWRHDLMPTRRLVLDGVSAATFKLAGASDGTTHKVRDRVLGAVKGVRRDELVALNEEIVPKLLDRIRPEARDLLDLHRRHHRATYIVSASPWELVEPLALALGMTGGIGTRSEVVDGVYTGELAGPFCYGAGKVEAINELVRWEGLDLTQCYAYSDSVSDLPMLEAVGHAVAVNPDAKLARVARRNGWPIVIFSRRTKSVIRRTTQAVGAAAIGGASFAAGVKLGQTRR